jgi:hypothetical protein
MVNACFRQDGCDPAHIHERYLYPVCRNIVGDWKVGLPQVRHGPGEDLLNWSDPSLASQLIGCGSGWSLLFDWEKAKGVPFPKNNFFM